MATTLDDLSALVQQGIHRAIELGGGSRDSEGELRLLVPPYYDKEFQPVALHLTCYLLGPHRSYKWERDSVQECIEAAYTDVSRWIEELEVEDDE